MLLITSGVSTTALSQSDWLAVAPKTSTLGLGADLVIQVTPGFNTRLGLNGISTKLDLNFSDVDYEVDFDMESYSAILDWYPNETPFRVSAGLLYNNNKADFEADRESTYKLGDNFYSTASVGKLTATVRYGEELAPYIGIGWGNPFDTDKRIGWMCDFGLAYTGSPRIRLNSTGGGVTGADLAKEEQDIQNDLDKLKFFPVLSLSLFIKF
jgi:hypothetical protein